MGGRSLDLHSEVNFVNIRCLKGDQRKGFEALTVHLLPWLVDEPIAKVNPVEGRGGDGGVEALVYLVSGACIGLQAKYFFSLNRAQWCQIEESVKTAMEKHPQLSRYLVCIPLERTPAQIKKWESLCASWRQTRPQLVVEWVGESALLGHLLKPAASHLKTYWFACPDFSLRWAAHQTELAIQQLHNRYTPRLHQPTRSEKRLEFLLALPTARVEHRNQCSDLLVAWREILRQLPDELQKSGAAVGFASLSASFDSVFRRMQEGDLTAQREPLVAALDTLNENADKFREALYAEASESQSQHLSVTRSLQLEDAQSLIYPIAKNIRRYLKAQREPIWMLTGEAGTGKSHLLAELSKKLLEQGRVCLLLVGERFAIDVPPAEQIPGLLNWPWHMRDLLACLSGHAALTGQASILMLDAVNEPSGGGLWRREIQTLAALVAEYSGVRLLVSCRKDCLRSTLPADMQSAIVTIEHHGFDLRFHEAVQAYFEGYQVTAPQYPTLNPEFQNPLFLKTLCEAYQGKSLPLGQLTFMGVLKAWEKRIATNIEEKIGCSMRATGRALNALIHELALSEAKWISVDKAEEICLQHFFEQRVPHSLFWHLKSEGLLQEVEIANAVWVRLQYERFSDVSIAQVALEKFSTAQQWFVHWESTFLPARIHSRSRSLDWSVLPELSAYALLLPDAVGVELLECPLGQVIQESGLASHKSQEILLKAWLAALPWRTLGATREKVTHLFEDWAKKEDELSLVWKQLFQLACVPQHPLNADYLHTLLSRWSMPDREVRWTLVLAHEDPHQESDDCVVGPFLYWTDASGGLASGEQVRLAAQVLLWLTTSPNRILRDRATDVAIRSLVRCSQAGVVCAGLLEQFWSVDDPYVKERLLAVMCGVLPHLNALNARPLVNFVFLHFWQEDDIAPHILQREYAAFIVRHACEMGLLPKTALERLERWSKKSRPVLWTEEQVNVYSKNPDYWRIEHSLIPEETGPGMYGDFGRYTMGSSVHHFEDNERAEVATAGLTRGKSEHDARFARRYIWQRVIELGWTPERFSAFEKSLGYSPRTGNRLIERISKKYQWIGLHEYLGHLSDALLYKEWGAPSRPLRGAWELCRRDYHPELALGTGITANKWSEALPVWWQLDSPIPSLNTVAEKIDWVQSSFQSFEPYLKVEYEQRRWVILHTHLNFSEELGFGVGGDGVTKISQWIDIRLFLVPNAEFSKRWRQIENRDFFGDGCEVPSAHQCWISEYPWHPIFAEVDAACLDNHTWFGKAQTEGYYLPVCEISEDDWRVPLLAPSLHRDLGNVLGSPLSAPNLTQQGGMEIHDASGRCIVKSSTHGATVLMVDEEVLMHYLKARNLKVVWAVLSQKSAWDGHRHVGGLATQSAAYKFADDGAVSGGLTVNERIPPEIE